MANVLRPVLDPEDERAFLRFLAQAIYEVYPRRVPAGWKPFRAVAESWERLPAELYLAATDLGPVLVDKVKRGPDRGHWRVDEVRSRSSTGALAAPRTGPARRATLGRAGRHAADRRRDAAPDRFRRRFLDVEAWLKKTCRRSGTRGVVDRSLRRAPDLRRPGAPGGGAPGSAAASLPLTLHATRCGSVWDQRRGRRATSGSGRMRAANTQSATTAAAAARSSVIP